MILTNINMPQLVAKQLYAFINSEMVQLGKGFKEIEKQIQCDEFEMPEDNEYFIEQTDDISMIGVKV